MLRWRPLLRCGRAIPSYRRRSRSHCGGASFGIALILSSTLCRRSLPHCAGTFPCTTPLLSIALPQYTLSGCGAALPCRRPVPYFALRRCYKPLRPHSPPRCDGLIQRAPPALFLALRQCSPSCYSGTILCASAALSLVLYPVLSFAHRWHYFMHIAGAIFGIARSRVLAQEGEHQHSKGESGDAARKIAPAMCKE